MSYNPDQPRDAQGRWGSGGFSAKGVTLKGVPQAKDKSQETAQYYANRAAFHAGKHHEHVQAYHAATTAEEKSAHALKAQASLKYLKQNVKWAGEVAGSGDQAHVAAAKLMQMKAELHHEGVEQTEKGKTNPKVAKLDAEKKKLKAIIKEDAEANADYQKKAKEAENHSTSAAFVGEQKSHHDAAMAHKAAALAADKAHAYAAMSYHKGEAEKHLQMAAKLAQKKGFDEHSFDDDGLVEPVKPKSPDNEKAIADMKAKMDAGKKAPDPDAEAKAENKLKNAQAYHDSAVEHMKNKHYDSAAENFAKAKSEAEEAMKIAANPDKTSKIYPQAMKLKDAAHTKMFDAKQMEKSANDLKQKAGEKDGITGLHKINQLEYDAGFKAESKSHFVVRKKEFTAALTSDERSALAAYTGSGYLSINGKLQKGDAGGEKVAAIDAALQRPEAAAPHDMIVHRSTYAKYYPDLKEGAVISYAGFSSTTISKEFADNWSGDAKIHISVPKGHPCPPIPSVQGDGEWERLLPRDQKLRVTKIEKGTSGTIHIHVEAMPHDFKEVAKPKKSKKAA